MTGATSWLAGADRFAPWREATVLVAGIGASGFAAADALLELDATVIIAGSSSKSLVLDRTYFLLAVVLSLFVCFVCLFVSFKRSYLFI